MQNIIEPIFGNYPFEEGWDTEMLEDNELLTLAEQTGVTSVLHYGFIELPRNATHIFEVTVADRIQMNRNRVGMQRLVRRLMSGQNQQSAFMIFHYADQWQLDWRFSYCHYGDREMTTAKRYTFLLGPGQACRTAAQNFCKLFEHRGELTPDDITTAFDVEALSKEFFNKYKEHYDRFCAYVYNNKENTELFGEAFTKWDDKTIRDYVKKLLGRIVFLHFLQKKGWMGVPADKPWGEGDRQFMKTLFDKATDKQKANYLDEVLEPLFADALDVDRKANDDLFDCNVEGFRNVKIPYLNGGLFERDKLDEPKSTFSRELFADFFSFLYQYNFTIDENDPNDAEIGVDPEMLGRIFENLLEDNKDKGAFYTPKEIVQYMCKESLIAYLQTDIKSEEMLQRLRDFVRTYDVELIGGADCQTAKDVDEYLKVVKICDPAIGSGAFPMGLMKELYLCRSAIEGFDGKKAAEIKKHIIQQNIYGVDIEKGAVDIARLRFWLSLVLDEETPHALPNLDFKIMQGNSLLEQYKGVDLSQIMHTKKAVQGGVQLSILDNNVDELRRQLVAFRNAYYRANNKQEKIALRASMRNIVQQQIEAQHINVELGNIDIAETSEFFLWHTWFSEVFDNGGFDIVIGNPPYVEAKKLKHIASTLKPLFDVYSGTADLSIYFVEHGKNILAANGILSYITTNKFFNTGYGKPLRKLIISNEINKMINFEQVEVFEGVLVSSVILEIRKAESTNSDFTYEKFYKLNATQFKEQFVSRIGSFGTYPSIELDENEWSFSDVLSLKVKKHIEEGHKLLGDTEGVNIYRGVTTGYNPAFIIDNAKRDELIAEDPKNATVIKNMLQGRNIRKWYYNESNENMIFTRKGTNIDEYPTIKNYLYAFYNNLKSRDPNNSDPNQEGRKPGNYKWFEILDNTAYYREFEKHEKIIWGLTADKWAYTLDTEGHYLPSNGYILTSTKIPTKYILGILNSRLLHYYFGFIGVMTAGGAYTLKAATVSALPFVDTDNYEPIITLVDHILAAKKANPLADTTAEEREIDRLVYDLYGLTEDEIAIVEGTK